MKKTAAVIAALIAAVLIGVNFVSAGITDSVDVVTEIRGGVDEHVSRIRSENDSLLKMSPDALAAADFSAYDTSGVLLGTELYTFDKDERVLRGKNAEDIFSGKENKIYTVGGGDHAVHTLKATYGYPDVFVSNVVLRSAIGERASFTQEYPEEVPQYQVVKNIENVYVENVDFNDFYTIKFEYCDNIIFNNCTFNGFANNGLVFRGCSDVTIVNCAFNDCGNEMSDNTNSGYSIRIVGGEDCPSENILIENCVIENSCGKAISFAGSVDNYVIRNNTVTDSVWGAIDYWKPVVSGEYVNVIENNVCKNVGFGKPSANDAPALTSGVGCAAIFSGMGTELARTVVKNNVVDNAVETGIEGPYELVYHNTVRNTGENSAARYTGSTEAVYIKLAANFEQKYIGNSIETRGMRCFSAYSDADDEYRGVYILNNSLKLKDGDASITCNYTRSDIEINCKKLKKLVISGNTGMMTDKPSVNVYIRDKNYVMDTFVLNDPCMPGSLPTNVKAAA